MQLHFFLIPRAPVVVSKTERERERGGERRGTECPDKFRDYVIQTISEM